MHNLAGHKFNHNFHDCVNHGYSCGQEIETSTPFHLYCSNYHYAKQTLFEKVSEIHIAILKKND